MDSPKWPRKSFQEAMELTRLPASDTPTTRFMSRQPAWRTGGELAAVASRQMPELGLAAFGGCVYAQAPLAAARVVEEEDRATLDLPRRYIHVSAYWLKIEHH